MTPRLRAAYRAAEYRAEGAVARVGRRSAAMDAVLARMGAREAVFLTAWNPRSRRMPLGWNLRMQHSLRSRLRRVAVVAGEGRGRFWAEAHLLAALPVARAMVLARRFRQYGMVQVRPRRRAELVLRGTIAERNQTRTAAL